MILPKNGGNFAPRTVRARNILVLSDYQPGNANAIADFLYAFDRYSTHRYYYAMWPRRLEPSFDFSDFDVIVIFWSIYFPPPPGVSPSLPPDLTEKLRQSTALKVLFRQDEYVSVDRLHIAMEQAGINLMFTCVAEDDHGSFYPTAKLPSLRGVHTVLTGYVPQYLESPSLPRKRRPLVDIGYRSRVVNYTLGDLGREKFVICEQFSRLGPAHGFSVNLSVREEDRLYGGDWLRFLRSTRFQLGTPSGASVIDFTGDIAAAATRFLNKHPSASYAEVRRRFFADIDGRILIDTISPRLFEYTATGNVMVLHEGSYGGLLEPGVHYIPVRKDYSNISEVFARMRDSGYCNRMHSAAYQHLIASGLFSYRSFATWFDSTLESYLPAAVMRASVSRASFYARRIASSRQNVIPIAGYEVTLPVHGGASYWHRRLLDAFATRIPLLGARFRRRGGSAFEHLRRGLIVLGAVSTYPSLRQALWSCWTHRNLRSRIGLYDLLRELGWLSALGASQGHRTFVVPRFDGETGCLRLHQLRTSVRPLTLERLKRGDYRPQLDAIAAHVRSGQSLQIQIELARGEHGLNIGSLTMRTHVARVCPEGFRLPQFARLLEADDTLALRVLRAVLEPRPPRRRVLGIESMSDLAASVKVVVEIARWPGGLHSMGAYWLNARLRSRSSLRQYVREVWLWTGLHRAQKARAYVSNPFWLEARLDGDVLHLLSRPGHSPGGTVAQREVIDAAWGRACEGNLDRVEWNHCALGEVFAWQLPGQPWQSVRLGMSGVETFRAIMLRDAWWKLLGDTLHLGNLSPPLQSRKLRFRIERGFARLRVFTGVAHAADGLRLLFQYAVDPRMRARASFPQLVREIWLSIALAGVQQARAYVPRLFWLEASIEGAVLKLVSRPGLSAGGTPRTREMIEWAWSRARAGALDRVEWDHTALGDVFAWRLPGQSWQSVRFEASGVETFRSAILRDSWWKLLGDALHLGTVSPPPPSRKLRFQVQQGFAKLRVLMGVAHAVDGLRLLGQFVVDTELRSRTSFPQLVREAWLWIALTAAQEARAFVPKSFWVEVSIEGTTLKFVSRPGTSPGGTSRQRELIEAAWVLARNGTLEQIVWDHRALGEVFAWQLPGHPWQSVRLGTSGVETFHAVLRSNAWWHLAGRALLTGKPAAPSHSERPNARGIRTLIDARSKARLAAVIEVAKSWRGLRSMIAYWFDRRINMHVSYPRLVRELWLWMALSQVQKAQAQTPDKFWVELKLEGELLRLVSRRGTATDVTPPSTRSLDQLIKRGDAETTMRMEWDHREIGEVFSWNRPGRPSRSMRLDNNGIEIFRALPLLRWSWTDLQTWGSSPRGQESDCRAEGPGSSQPATIGADIRDTFVTDSRRLDLARNSSQRPQTALVKRVTR